MRPPTEAQLTSILRIAAVFTLDADAARALTVRAVRAYPNPAGVSESRLTRALWLGAHPRPVISGTENPTEPINLPGMRSETDAYADAINMIRTIAEFHPPSRDALINDYAGVLPTLGLAHAHLDSSTDAIERLEAAERALSKRSDTFDPAKAREQIAQSFSMLSLSPEEPDVRKAFAAASRRSRIISTVGGLLLLACLLGMGLIIADLLGWDERKADLDALSNPLPKELSDQNISDVNIR